MKRILKAITGGAITAGAATQVNSTNVWPLILILLTISAIGCSVLVIWSKVMVAMVKQGIPADTLPKISVRGTLLGRQQPQAPKALDRPVKARGSNSKKEPSAEDRLAPESQGP